jgi:sialate O-acetylesterase
MDRTTLASLALLAASFLAPAAQASTFRMPPVLSSNMVLQAGRPSTFWGVGAPGTTVRLEPGWENARVVTTSVKPDGSWRLAFTPPAGPGPYELRVVAADTTVRLVNVLVGEVWLCSGQSNMEMPLAGWPPGSPVAGSDSAIATAAKPRLRLFTVTRKFAAAPESTFDGAWVECTPATATTFSATGFFFGRTLQDALGAPVGLIQSAWGGTPVEAWMSGGALAPFPEYRGIARALAEAGDSVLARDRWLHRHPSSEIDEAVAGKRWEDLDLGDSACARPGLDDHDWRSVSVPGDWEDHGLGAFDGVAWYRRSVTIPRAWIGHALTLRLGPVDDMDRTWVNGAFVGGLMGLDHWRTPRVYTVPAELVRDTLVHVAVRVVDFVGGGGLWGNGQPIDLYASDSTAALTLAGEWKLLPVAEFFAPLLYTYGGPENDFAARPRVPVELGPNAPSALHNAMIAPLAPLSLRGAIWYQGEANVGNPGLYARLFPAMIDDWRRAFGQQGLPFYYTQIAPFDYGPGVHSELLREAQLQALRVPHSGMAVTLDVGAAHDIHPRFKREVGERLAAWALARTYGRRVPCSGPLYRSMKREPGRLVLTFGGAEGGLVLRPSAEGSSFEVAGADGTFVPADARVDGATVVLTSARVPAPVQARYAFRDTPAATLFDAAGLPAASFRTDAPAR